MTLPPETFFDSYVPSVRAQVDYLLASMPMPTQASTRIVYYHHGAKLIESIIRGPSKESAGSANSAQSVPETDSIDDLLGPISPALDAFDFTEFDMDAYPSLPNPVPNITIDSSSVTPNTCDDSAPGPSTAATSPPSPDQAPVAGTKVESNSCCEICGYRPEGDPRWFPGSMAKHKKLQHATSPPRIYHCPYPGCSSKYTNRPDNLRQHQLKKGHFVDGEDEAQRRPSKRKKMG